MPWSAEPNYKRVWIYEKEWAKRSLAKAEGQFAVTTASGISGISKDISATGIYFELDEKQELGSLIAFWIELDTPGGILKVVCEGEVARVVEEGGKMRVAARILNQRIES